MRKMTALSLKNRALYSDGTKPRVLLLTPPMTQLNTPYPATAYITGFLKKHASDLCIPVQADPAQLLTLRLFSRAGLIQIRDEIVKKSSTKSALPKVSKKTSASVAFFLQEFGRYERAIDAVVSFLQSKDGAMAYRLLSPGFLPEGPRFHAIESYEKSVPEGLHFAFGSMGIQDKAKYLASLFLDDVSDVIRHAIDERFTLSRYAESLASSVPSFDDLYNALSKKNRTLIEIILDEIVDELAKQHSPQLVALTVPFPGNVYGAFRIAKRFKELLPDCKVVLGGGYVNTELRELSEPRVFDFMDFVCLDDGEAPLLAIIKEVQNVENKKPAKLVRTFVREHSRVIWVNDKSVPNIPFKDAGTPTYEGLALDKYLSVFEFLNPMHRMWSDGRWNKLTLAHGCYWKGCSFCDTSLDYISRYEDQSTDQLISKMQQMIDETGQRGFHFVDEAAPPKILFSLSRKIIERKISVSWWGNVRFEKTFSHELAGLMAEAGCVAISGGLEVASDRLLKLMNKGVTVEQVARVTHAFAQAGVLVHAYLMYGFPTQTEQETIDSLERVRQLFKNGCLHSAYWHRFAATIHSPIGKNPDAYGITLLPLAKDAFAKNDIGFIDPVNTDHDALAIGLNRALYNYMHGIGLDEDVRAWFDTPVPKAKVPKTLVQKALKSP